MFSSTYDTIIIGSGAGGLTAAVALAQAGQNVLVCEQHEVPGGWTHSFTLEGYRFNTGVHYIGELGEGERLRKIYEGLGVSNDLTFLELNPDAYDHILIGDYQFDIPKGKEAFIHRLKERFPDEAKGIDLLFEQLANIYSQLLNVIDEKWFSLLRCPTALPWFTKSGGDLIKHYVKNPLLRAILLGQCGAHGLPPSQVSAAIHAAIIQHYIEGAYHPLGGGMTIARAMLRALKKANGTIRLNTSVNEIILDKQRAIGVRLSNGEIVRSKHVISNADPYFTFNKLIGKTNLSRKLKSKLKKVRWSTSCFSLYLVIDCDLRKMGLDSGNYWIYSNENIEQLYQLGLTDYNVHNLPAVMFVTATSLKDPSKSKSNHHQLEVFSFVSYDFFKRWENQVSGQRDAEYIQLKEKISNNMISSLDHRFPGISKSIILKELGTPLTNYHYIKAHRGNIYGIDKSIWQAGPLGFRNRTEFKDLYMCGSSTLAHGIAYASYSGLIAASKLLRCRPMDLLKQNGPELEILQCER
ncbi:MAG: NAD(P)/FAD-dependent oxidoreductase [Ignavibacteriae bacterium]|nr:NAD(P)/FAD-dependent oxidoreductase [Ignavibacteriota bacterium]NOG98926.1 NAD(P)/FAD-dependent oxidoreductase [Ignavibacteriota bacterium]